MLLAVHINDLWYALPLIVSVSLVYSATRAEQMRPILTQALRFGTWVLGFMAAAFAVLYWLSARP
ncbi:MAG TPA: hypothetical protein VHZ24_02395 [Pirellulales bacterium]|jgi:hypothetical protein|nr:hypothetical protein [Pirellulales bacterium]